MPVFINNESDYLGPSQACVNPLFAPPPKPTQSADANLAKGSDGDNGLGKQISNSSANDGDDLIPKSDNAAATKKIVPSRRRLRQRRAPRIIKSEDNNNNNGPPPPLPARIAVAAAGDPVVLLTNDKDKQQRDDEVENSPAINTVTTHKIKKKASVTLSDCLSCSGCVTSAEAVLMSHHSIDKLREVSGSQNEEQGRRIVFTISSASLADLYRHLYLENDILSESTSEEEKGLILPSRHELLTSIAEFLRSEFGAEMVVDGALSQRISLMESASEFCYRYAKTQQHTRGNGEKKDATATGNPSLASKKQPLAGMPSIALSSTKTRYINKDLNGDAAMEEDTLMEVTTLSHPPGRVLEQDCNSDTNTGMTAPIQSTSLPVLASSCPGFVCLVEKTAPAVVPLLSSAKSPMTVAGTLLKTGQGSSALCTPNDNQSVGPEIGVQDDADADTNSCYHVAIMPCHDKKLEAGRGDFAWEKQALLQYGNSLQSISKINTKPPMSGITVEGVNDEEGEDLVHEVDLVLTTGELLEVLSEAAVKQKDMVTPAPEKLPDSSVRNFLSRNGPDHGSCKLMTATVDSCLIKNEEKDGKNNLELDTGVHGSGSYADFIFRYAAQDLFGCKLPHDKPLPWKGSSSSYATAGKTAGVIRRRRRRQETTDLREVTLYEHNDGTHSCDEQTNGDEGGSSKPVLRFATAYGFKNVQLILQSLSKTGSSSSDVYDYVEIMACPSGCSNGGGQIGANGQRETPRETKERVKKTVSAVPIIRPSADGCGSMADSFCGCDTQGLAADSILQSKCFDGQTRQLFHTHFHVVPKLELSTGATAGVAVSDTNW